MKFRYYSHPDIHLIRLRLRSLSDQGTSPNPVFPFVCKRATVQSAPATIIWPDMKALRVITIVLTTIIGICLGGFLGFWMPWEMAQEFVAEGGDETAAGAFSFFTIITVPLGAYLGGGISLAVSLLVNKSSSKGNPSRNVETP